ncbi:hypothetical protein M0R04_09450 [Candidatus Dojkabacteria bacterium]|jgi:hypothetical protein|nr:hypothetical protein [Candidatus Dojkabacteria bacterium]
MATLLTPTIIAKETLMQLSNSLAMGKHVYTQFKNEFQKVGATVTIRKPNKFRATDTASISKTTIVEPSTSITVDTQSHVAWEFTSAELTTTIEDYSKRYIQPAALALANKVDVKLCELYADVYNYAGTPGTTPATFAALGEAQRILDDEDAPSDKRIGIFNPKANWALADGLKGTFAQNVAKDIMTRGYLGQIANLDMYMDQNIVRHLNGAFEADIQVTSEPVSGATTLVTKNWGGSSTVKKGDVFTIAGVYAVNPMSGASTGELRRFTVTADTSDDGAAMTIPVAPSIISSGAYQTVDSLPAVDALLTFVGTAATRYSQNLVFHPNAFGLVVLPLELPSGVWGARESDPDLGLSVRVIKQYDIDTDKEVARVDILFGVKTLYRELACRVWGE